MAAKSVGGVEARPRLHSSAKRDRGRFESEAASSEADQRAEPKGIGSGNAKEFLRILPGATTKEAAHQVAQLGSSEGVTMMQHSYDSILKWIL